MRPCNRNGGSRDRGVHRRRRAAAEPVPGPARRPGRCLGATRRGDCREAARDLERDSGRPRQHPVRVGLAGIGKVADSSGASIVAASGDDLVRRNVSLDLLRGIHSYRSDLFVRADAPPPEEPYAWRKLSFSCRRRRELDQEKGGTAVKYIDGDLVASIADPDQQKVLDLLIASAPAELGYAAIAAQTGVSETRLDDFLRLGAVGQIVDRHASPQPFVTAPGERPLVSPVVRAHLAHDMTTVNLRHRKVDLEDGPLRLLLVLSDGTRTRSEIGAAVADTFGVDVSPQIMESAIARLAQLRVFQG